MVVTCELALALVANKLTGAACNGNCSSGGINSRNTCVGKRSTWENTEAIRGVQEWRGWRRGGCVEDDGTLENATATTVEEGKGIAKR